ncbi:nucleotide-sugar transporter-domain-containing protein, partial [Gorgonomyces haynaldii]
MYKQLSLAVLVVQASMHVLVLRYSRLVPGPKYIASTAVVMSEVIKLVVALGMYYYENKTFNGLSDKLFGPKSQKWHICLVAVLYFIQNNAQYIALSHLEAATFQITNQLKLFTTAFFAVLLLKHKLSFSKWMSLVLLFVGVCLINFAPSSSPKRQGHWIGLLAVMVSCTISGFAAAWFEMVLKSTPQSITLRNVQMALFSLVPGFFFAVLVVDGQQVRENGFFDGYTIWTWFAIILQAFGGLVVAAVVKYADSILKGFAVSISIVISSIASVFIFDFHLTTNFVVGAMIVLLSTQLY